MCAPNRCALGKIVRQILNEIFDLVVSNMTGFDIEQSMAVKDGDVGSMAYYRGGLDQLFYTCLYAIIVYMMAQASFKMVYLVPNNILRWMGSGVDGFGEIAKDEPGSLVGKVFGSASLMTNQMKASTQQAAMGIGSSFGGGKGK